MEKRIEKNLEKSLDATLLGSQVLQAAPMLSKAGRTPTALAGTTAGFVQISVAGTMAKTGFRAIKGPRAFKRKKKKKGR